MTRRSTLKLTCRCAIVCMAVLLPLVARANPQEIDLLTDTDAVRIDGEDVGDKTGARVVSCDVNGDGVQDLVISTPGGDGPGNTRTETGEVYVVFGRRGRWAGPLDLAVDRYVWIYGQQPLEEAGFGLACGDVDGDGFDDMVLGVPFSDSLNDARLNAGQAHIVFGAAVLPSEIDLLTDPGVVIYGEDLNGNFAAVGPPRQ